MIAVFIVLAAFFPIHVFAAQEGAGPPELEITSMLASLLIVLVCIFVFAYLMKQTNLLKNARGKSQIKIIATQPLTSKGRVQMIEINGQQYLLGVTEQNITLLDKLESPLSIDKASEKKVTGPAFSALLSKISKKTDE
ncbi:MAG: flagellar biosynthetic protein FliO [Psychromonas sp.]|nr:flagellar biosynthetic protein FliO [Psychromonas sp.]